MRVLGTHAKNTKVLAQRNVLRGKRLLGMFDLQHFQQNRHLAALIEETEAQYDSVLLEEDLLLLVSVAGDGMMKLEREGRKNRGGFGK